MKIKNLAFFGVMASILGVGGAYADNTTVIASKSYVDNKVATKEATANKETGNTLTDSTTLYPSSHTVKAAINAIDVSGQLTNYATNSDLETGLATKVDKDQKSANKDKMMVTDTNGKVAVYDKDDHITLDHQNKLIKISGFQAPIDDLSTIRSGATAGATAVQPAAISDMETQTHAAATYQPKGNYLTSHQNISGKEDVSNKSNSVLITMDEGGKNIESIDAGTDKAYATTQSLGKDFTSIKKAIDTVKTLASDAVYDDSAVQSHMNNGDIHVTAAQKTTWSGKQDAISDLATIRSGAAAGATAVQPAAISDMEVQSNKKNTALITMAEGDKEIASVENPERIDAKEYATRKSIATDLTNVKKALDNKQGTISDLATIRSGAAAGATAVQPAAISDMLTQTNAASTYETKTHASETYQPKGNYLTSHQDISGKEDVSNKSNSVLITMDEGGKNIESIDAGTDKAYATTQSLGKDFTSIKKAIDTVKTLASDAVYDDSAVQSHMSNGDIHVTAAQKTTWSGKQDAISDLATIRSGAAAGATAVQPGDLNNYQKKADSKVEEDGNLILAGNEVAKNLGLLDTKIGKEDMGTEADTLTGAIAEVKGIAESKQDAINDLATIRSNASSAIKGVKLNGTALTADSNGAVNVTSVVEGVATVTGQGEAITAVTESNHKVAATKSKLTYAGAMDSSLANINGEGSCEASKPCVLTYNGSDYVWTNMDLGN